MKVGDWIVVGDEQGYVKRINVRSTQIETFDRATLIVPNSTLVSGTVKNWVHSDRVGRVIVTIPVPRDADSDVVASLMRAAAQENPDVLEDPPPRVLFKRITESAQTFDLVCFVGEVDMAARVSSDLTFAIVRKMRETGIIKPAGPTKFELDGILDLQEEVARLRAAIDQREQQRLVDGDPRLPSPRTQAPPMTRLPMVLASSRSTVGRLHGRAALRRRSQLLSTARSGSRARRDGRRVDDQRLQVPQGAAALALDAGLSAEARRRAASVAATDTSTWGEVPRVQQAAAGGPQRLRRERVSAGYRTMAEAFSGWRDSPPHEAVLLERAATRLGIAAVDRPGTKYRVYWAVIVE